MGIVGSNWRIKRLVVKIFEGQAYIILLSTHYRSTAGLRQRQESTGHCHLWQSRPSASYYWWVLASCILFPHSPPPQMISYYSCGCVYNAHITQVLFHFWVLMYGNTPTTFSTRMSALTTSRPSGMLSTGRTWQRGSRMLARDLSMELILNFHIIH